MITEIINFSNGELKTPLARKYKFSIIGSYLNIDCQRISDIILEKEKEISSLDLSPQLINCGGTGLDSKSMTARHKNYNVLTWNYPEIIDLKRQIRSLYDQSCDYFCIDKNETVFIQCWANVLRKGQKMNIHRHISNNDENFLSGHISIKCDNTQTIYHNPYSEILSNSEYYYFENIPGRINIFESVIYHHTTEHTSDSERITIAFDLNWKYKPKSGIFVEL